MMISPVLPRSTLREIVLHHHAVALSAHRPRHALAFRLERRPTEQQLPSEPDPALAGVALAAVGKTRWICIDARAKSRASDARRRCAADFAHPTRLPKWRADAQGIS